MKLIDLTVRLFLPSILLLSIPVIGVGQSTKDREDLTNAFRKFDVARISSATSENISGESRTLSLTANGDRLELNIVPNDVRSENYRAEDTGPVGNRQIDAPALATYKGVVRGRSGSEVRLSINGSKIEGFFTVGSDRFFIEPRNTQDRPLQTSQSFIGPRILSSIRRSLATRTFLHG